ncbi:hypothetical protein DPMN_020777 [Dreissena polymorpha]|uniref:Secreted protein n=1 Tax=Dreissena polymorpha TaxID=45954 RepID=A0A9D4NN40_DREPO|nr:hypothetical protein DPMN_020777 [Dreissena polymorpha]
MIYYIVLGLSVCLSVCLPACLPASLPACLSACLPACLCVFLSQNFNFDNLDDSNLIFGMRVYLMELPILSGGRSRPGSFFKVKEQIHGSKVE